MGLGANGVGKRGEPQGATFGSTEAIDAEQYSRSRIWRSAVRMQKRRLPSLHRGHYEGAVIDAPWTFHAPKLFIWCAPHQRHACNSERGQVMQGGPGFHTYRLPMLSCATAAVVHAGVAWRCCSLPWSSTTPAGREKPLTSGLFLLNDLCHCICCSCNCVALARLQRAAETSRS